MKVDFFYNIKILYTPRRLWRFQAIFIVEKFRKMHYLGYEYLFM